MQFPRREKLLVRANEGDARCEGACLFWAEARETHRKASTITTRDDTLVFFKWAVELAKQQEKRNHGKCKKNSFLHPSSFEGVMNNNALQFPSLVCFGYSLLVSFGIRVE